MALSQEQMHHLEKLNATKFKRFICEICQGEFYATKANTIYCSSSCSSIAYRARIKERNRMMNLKLENNKPLIALPELTTENETEIIEVINEKQEKKPERTLMDFIYCRKK